jgi:hypothetical protein
MLQQFLQILIISSICCSWGLLPLLLLQSAIPADLTWYRSRAGFIAFLFLTGCMTLGVLSSWLYLLIPLKFFSLLALTAVQLLLTVTLGRRRLSNILTSLPASPVRGPALLFYVTCLCLFILLGSMRTSNTDTRIYHLQIVQWASAYPAVHGLANLFPRLGLGSNWLLLISFFHVPGVGHENYSYLDTSLVVWLFVWIFHHWAHHWNRRNVSSAHKGLGLFYLLLLAYSLLDWELFRNTASSTSYDTIVTVCLLMTLCYWAECILVDRKEPGPSRWFVFIGLSALGFKLSGFFILILLAYHLFRQRRQLNYWLFAVFSFLLIVAPVLIRSYIITGYPLYPLPYTIGHPDWKLPEGMTNLLNNYIVLSNRFYSSSFTNSYAFREQHPLWFGQWFKAIEPQHKLIILLCAVSLIFVVIRRKWWAGHVMLRRFMLLLLAMLAVWFFTAPSPRFSYATLLFAALLPVSLFAGGLIPDAAYRIGFLAATCCIFIYIPGKMHTDSFKAQDLLYPVQFRNVNDAPMVINGVQYHHPERPAKGYPCLLGSLPLPCTCQMNPFLQSRGPSLSDGFRMLPAPDSAFIQQYNY